MSKDRVALVLIPSMPRRDGAAKSVLRETGSLKSREKSPELAGAIEIASVA